VSERHSPEYPAALSTLSTGGNPFGDDRRADANHHVVRIHGLTIAKPSQRASWSSFALMTCDSKLCAAAPICRGVLGGELIRDAPGKSCISLVQWRVECRPVR
jgi:hypothetical protein